MLKCVFNGKIYNFLSGKIVQHDIKYKTKYVFQHDNLCPDIWYRDHNQIWLHYDNQMIIIKETINVIKNHKGYKPEIIGNNLLAYILNRNIFIEDLLTGTIKNNATYVYSFTLSQNEKQVLINRCDGASCIITIDSFLKMDFENTRWIIDCIGSPKILWEANKSISFYTRFIIIKNFESGTHKTIHASNYEIYVHNDMMYIITNDVVIIVDSFFAVTEVQNDCDVFGYSTTYHVFVNDCHELFRIIDGKLKKWFMRYDFWRDVDVPLIICYEVEILIDLELLPSELINEIYRQLILYTGLILTKWL